MSGLLVAVPALPLIAAPLILILGERLPRRGGELMVGATALALVALLLVRGEHGTLQTNWFEAGGFRLTIGLALDRLTWFVAVLVAGIALLVGIYSLGFMADEPHRPRFFAELALFVGAMLTLVLASSLILMFAAWEIVGLASYLLIGFRYEAEGAREAAAKAFLMTRIGDFGFLVAWLLVLGALHTTNIAALVSAASNGKLAPGLETTIALLFFLAAIGKSAQLPLMAWLPDAMIAPAPVSALIHSATMVAAGVYLLLRLYPLFAVAPDALRVVLWVGGASAVFSALVATAEMDMKRVLAWSTSSQLGEMMLAIGFGAPLAAALHLTNHAMFKSTLFLAAGAVARHAGTRDLRELGGLGHVLPMTALAFFIGALSLAGLQPFLFGSSEDAILAGARGSGAPAMFLIIALIFLGGVYIARAGIVVFMGPRPDFDVGPGERRLSMLVGMMGLATAAVLGSLAIAVVPRVLPFGPQPTLSWLWRGGALLAGAAGLAVGGWHASRYRAAPAIGWFPEALDRALGIATSLPVRLVQAVAYRVMRIEIGIDIAARSLAGAIRLVAAGSDRIERREFGAGGDRFANGIDRGGEVLRNLETGKLYLYTLGVFVWSFAVLIVGILLLGA